MSKKDLIHRLSTLKNFSNGSLIDLKEAIEHYPYAQALHVLYLLNLKKLKEDTFDLYLPKTAIRISDRTYLKRLVDKVETENKPLKMASAVKQTPKDLNETMALLKKYEGISAQLNALPIPRKADATISDFLSSIDIPNAKQKELQDEHREQVMSRIKQRLNEISGITGVETLPTPKAASKRKQPDDHAALAMTKPKTASKTRKSKPDGLVTLAMTKSVTHRQSKKKPLAEDDIINRFLQAEHNIVRIQAERDYENLSIDPEEHSLKENLNDGSETLAALYLKQGAPDKAIEIYKALSLKNPKKNRYFAKLIAEAELELKQQSKKNARKKS